jgi:hypothetical protein
MGEPLMTDTDMWRQMAIGFLLPAIIAMINRESFSTKIKYCITLVVCFIAGGIEAYLSGLCTVWAWSTLFRNFIKIAFVTFASYGAFWKPTGFAERIEKNVNVVGGGK